MSGEKGVWHDCGKGGGHAGAGKRGIGMTFGREAVMPKEGKRGYGMTFGEKGNQYARSHLTRLLFLAFIVSQQNKPPAMPV